MRKEQTSGVYDASAGMRRPAIPYTKAINKLYERVGGLFQGAFQAKHVDQDSYLAHLPAYIHLNPVDAALVKHVDS